MDPRVQFKSRPRSYFNFQNNVKPKPKFNNKFNKFSKFHNKVTPKMREQDIDNTYNDFNKYENLKNKDNSTNESTPEQTNEETQYKTELKKTYRNVYCTNCGKLGHEYRQCTDAVISVGVILLKFDYAKIKQIFSDLINSSDDKINIQNNGIKIESLADISLFSRLRENIKFLIIRRKHTLGYIEFIRGRYKPDNVDGIVFLFQQMTKEEISKIGSMSINELWDDFWIDPQKKLLYEREFQKTKQKFEKLKNGDETELTLDFYVKHVMPTWDQAEWGFPKGRRNKMESNKECALREFEEESGFTKDDYILLEGIKPLVEEFIGTNGIKYKHIYYVAYSNSDVIPTINKDNIHQATEIGDIGYYTYNEVMDMIRPYHVERKKIIMKLYMYLLEKIIMELKSEMISLPSNDDKQEDLNKYNTESSKSDQSTTIEPSQENTHIKIKKREKKVVGFKHSR